MQAGRHAFAQPSSIARAAQETANIPVFRARGFTDPVAAWWPRGVTQQAGASMLVYSATRNATKRVSPFCSRTAGCRLRAWAPNRVGCQVSTITGRLPWNR